MTANFKIQEKCVDEAAMPVFNFGILADFPESTRKNIKQSARKLDLKRGMVLFHQEDIATNFYIVSDGWVKLFRETYDGSEVILDILSANHLVGENALFHNGIYTFSAEVVSDAVLYAIPLSVLAEALESDKKTAYVLLKQENRKNAMLQKEIEHQSVQTAAQRIGCFLLRLIKDNPVAPIILYLPYDKMLVAGRLGMAPETFSRALTKLQKETGIAINGPAVKIENVERLLEYTCSACSNLYPCED